MKCLSHVPLLYALGYTRRMHLIIPYLFPSTEFLQAASQDLRLPALETLVARGRMQIDTPLGIEGALCRAWGIEKQIDWPWAAMSLLADNGAPDRSYWLRADPVHIRIQRDKLILFGSELLNVSADEAVTLCNDLNAHFGDELHLRPLQPDRWYWSIDHEPDIETTTLSLATGWHIDPLLPKGGAEMKWRALLNEMQMLLFSHPINQEREARGLPTINSIWLWGGGRASQSAFFGSPFYCADEHFLSVANHLGIHTHAWSGSMEEIETNGLVLAKQLETKGQYGDVLGWRETMKRMETEWFSRLIKKRAALKIEDPISGSVLDYAASDRWKIWRRAKPFALQNEVNPDIPLPLTSNVDEFGNFLG
ncbi:MAG: hypothetical protein WBX11_06960 [Thiobacillaceae bacterium]